MSDEQDRLTLADESRGPRITADALQEKARNIGTLADLARDRCAHGLGDALDQHAMDLDAAVLALREMEQQVEFQRARGDKWVAAVEKKSAELEAVTERADAAEAKLAARRSHQSRIMDFAHVLFERRHECDGVFHDAIMDVWGESVIDPEPLTEKEMDQLAAILRGGQ